MCKTSVPSRSEPGEKEETFSQSSSPILKEPQKDTRQTDQKASLSNSSPFQSVLAAWPKSFRKGMVIGLFVAERTILTGSQDWFSYPLKIAVVQR